MKLNIISLVFIVLFSTNMYSQTNYYVSMSGDNNNSGTDTTPSRAWRDIDHAAQNANAGDTIYIMAGTYFEIVKPLNSGTELNPITYTNYQNDIVIIDGTGQNDLNLSNRGIFDIKTCEYINIIGLQIQNSDAGGIMCRYGSSNINIINNRVLNCKATGIGVGYSRYHHPMAMNINVRDNFVNNCSTVHRESISLTGVLNFEISRNTVQNTPKEGIDAKSGCSDGIISDNIVTNAGAVGIYIDAGKPDIEIPKLYTFSHNIRVFRNKVKNSKTSFAVASEGGILAKDIWFYNNIAFDDSHANSQNGFVIANFGDSGPLENIYIINNTIHGKAHRGIYINNLNVDNIYIRNNICSQNTISQIDIKSNEIPAGVVTLENNLLDGYSEDFGLSPVIGDPKFLGILDDKPFGLHWSSPAINTGSLINAPKDDFEGNIRLGGLNDIYVDIGAYEFSTAEEQINEVSIFPNPAEGEFYVVGDNISIIQIRNSKGRLLKTVESTSQTTFIDLKRYKTGIVFVTIIQDNETIIKQVVLI